MKLRVMLAILGAPAWAESQIPAGTHLLLRMEHAVSTTNLKAGDGVFMRTASPLSVGGKIVVPLGSYAQGVIAQAKRSGRVRGKAQVEIRLTEIILASGQVVRIGSAKSSVHPKDRPGVARNPIGLGYGVLGPVLAGGIAGGQTGAQAGLAVGAAVLIGAAILARGPEVELSQGAAVDVVFEESVVIDTEPR